MDDFATPLHRRLAELYWEHQRHEGEPVFNEFLGTLSTSDAGLVDLAVEVVDEVEKLAPAGAEGRDVVGDDDAPDRDGLLRAAIEHLEHARKLSEAQKLLAELRRTTLDRRQGENQEPNNQNDISAANDAEISLLKQLQEKARQPDLRRVM